MPLGGYWGQEIMVCVSGADATQLVRSFGSYTIDLQAIGKWLQEHNIETVAMESTGSVLDPVVRRTGTMRLSMSLDQFTIFAESARM